MSTQPYPEGMTRNYNDWQAEVTRIQAPLPEPGTQPDPLKVEDELTQAFIKHVGTALIAHDYKEARQIYSDFSEERTDIQLRMFGEAGELYEGMAELAKAYSEASTSSKA